MKPLLKSLLLTLPLFCLFQLTSAQGLPVRWANFYPPDWEANNFTAEAIIEITNGGIVVAGTRRFESLTQPHNEVMVMRIDVDGDMIWQKSFGGETVDYIRDSTGAVIETIYTPWEQVANDMLQTHEGNFLVTGFRDQSSDRTPSSNKLLLIEISPSGEVITESSFLYLDKYDCEGYSIAPAIGGGYVVAATLRADGYGSNDMMMLLRLQKDAEGLYVNYESPWSVNSQLGIYTHPRWIRPLMSGYLVGGTMFSVNTKNQIFLQRTNEDRTEKWTNYFGGANDDEFGDAVIYDEHIYLAGSSKVPVGAYEYYQVYVVKMDFQGDTIWTRTYGGPSTNYGITIDVVENDLMIGVNAIDAQMHSQMALLKVDAVTGDSLWMQTYGSFYSAGIRSATRTSDLGYLLAGRASYTGTQDPRIYVMRFNNSSNTVGQSLVRENLKLDIVTTTPTKDVISVTSDKNNIYGVTVVINSIIHPSVGDLEITLEHEGTAVTLIDQPEHSGENFIHTGLVDVSENPIAAGYAPYTGWFRPEQLLLPFLEHAPSGEWTLTVTDHGTGGIKSTGSVLEGWTLNLMTEAGAGTGISPQEAMMNFGLEPVRPNPFSREALVSFRIAEAGRARVTIYNQLGQLVGSLVDEDLAEGVHERVWQPSGLTLGTYFIRLESGGLISVRKAVLTR
jgi:subtilisin-like proprotein convertase family protein